MKASYGDETATLFEAHRGRLFALAYRMLGRVADAEDVVQEVFARWADVPQDAVRDAGAYLATMATRLCLDQLRSAREQREQYIGPWLPEPLVDEASAAHAAELADSLSVAFLVLLETLTPDERAVFLLREVFGYSYAEVGEAVGKGEAACRQLAHRARKHLEARRVRGPSSRAHQEALVARFLEATHGEDLDGLLDLLAHDSTLYSDGGGKVTAARKPIYGAGKIARFLVGLRRKAPSDLTVRLADVGGAPGFVVEVQGQRQSIWSFAVDGAYIQTIYVVLNPEKLGVSSHESSSHESSSHASSSHESSSRASRITGKT